jgi:cysteine desulfurase
MAQKPASAAARVVYLDANATTLMPQPVIDAFLLWCNRGNASAEYASAREARKMMEAFRLELARECDFDLVGPDSYAVVFTSGASESNCHIVTSAVRSYAAKTKKLPHVVTSAAEHKSLLACCQRLAKEGLAQLTILPVAQNGARYGAVDAKDLENALRPNTCLVSVMAANNETGILNNLRELAAVARRAHVPFHTDAVQLVGKSAFHPTALGVDAFSASFHKLHGPPGVGLLVLRRALIEGYDLCPHICGSQNEGLRGGTENLPGIAASFVAYRSTMLNRAAKTARVQRLRAALMTAIGMRLPCFYVEEHPADAPPSIDGGITRAVAAPHNGSAAARRAIAVSEKSGSPVVFWIAPQDTRKMLPNTILLSVRRPGFCNKAARAALESRGVIVSLGSACNATDAAHGNASSVVQAMGVPGPLLGGVLRVSLDDDTNTEDIKIFTRDFLEVVSSDECLSAAYMRSGAQLDAPAASSADARADTRADARSTARGSKTYKGAKRTE